MNQYIELVLMGLSASVGYAILGLIVGGLIVYLLHRNSYLERFHILLKIITKLYFVVIPISFFFYFWFFGSLNTTKNVLNKSVKETLSEVAGELYPQFATYVNEEIKTFIHLDEIPSNTEIVHQYLTKRGINTEDKFYKFSISLALKKILDVSIGDTSDREKRVTALSNGLSEEVFAYGFDALHSEIKRQIQWFFGLMITPSTIAFLGIVIFICLEVFISKKYINPRMMKKNAEV